MSAASGWGTTPRRTARRIIREALDRNLRPGDRLARERTLVEFFGVSRSTMRNALGLLAFLGAVEGVAGKSGGSRMAAPSADAVTSSLGMVLQAQGADLATVVDALAAVAPTVARLAADRADAGDLKELAQRLGDLDPAADAATFAAGEQRLAVAVARSSGNVALAAFVEALTRITTLEPIETTVAERRASKKDASALVDAIAAGDAASAHDGAVDHWGRRRRNLETKHRSALRRRLEWPAIDELLDADEASPRPLLG
jgi:GntR family transcriptional regulator, transcriptional repressor for pyruvate dehydrogenase complex